MLLRKVYRFQMRPTKAQEDILYQMAGAKRFVYNWALAARRDAFEATGTGLTYNQQAGELTKLKKQPDTAWLGTCDSQMLQQALRDVDRAFKNFFEKRAKYPRFKSCKDNVQSFRIPQRVKVEDGKVYVPKIGWVRIRQSQDVDCKTKGATFKRDACGKWYVTLTAEFEMPDVPLPPAKPENVIGVDLGLKDFAVLSTGERFAPPKHYRAAERKLRKAQRALSRKQKGSKNRDKARQRLARIHSRVQNKRQDFLHKLTTSLVQNYDGLCIEDLSLLGMARTKLAKSVSDAALGEFRRQLEYKAVWHRKHLATIDRFFPSSRLCGECGAVNDALTLADRAWACGCGTIHDRDLNAARNIRTEGLKLLVAAGHAETLNACGAQVRPALISRRSVLKQESHVL